MKKNIKKGILTLGTLAAIASPIAAVISCGETRNTINWKDDDTYGGVSGTDFLKEIKHLGKTKQNSVTVAKEQMMQLQYESESIRSISAEIEQFRYENWQTYMDNKKLDHDISKAEEDKTSLPDSDQDGKDSLDEKIKTFNKSKEDNTKKINEKQKLIDKLEDVISKLNIVQGQEFLVDKDDAVANFYKDDYSSSDYPDIYKSLSSIREEKTNVVNDAYRQFYPQFTTKKDGDKEWPSELAKNYGNAATFSQAIDYLVTQEISSKAFNSYKFEINKSFTVEQKLWAQYIDKKAFKFLIEDTANNVAGSQSSSEIADDIKLIGTDKDTIEDNILKINRGDTIGSDSDEKTVAASVLSSNEMFLGSKSPDHRIPEKAIEELGKVVKYQHLLIKATQGDTPEDVWTIKAEDLQKLMKFDQYDIGSGPTIGQGLSFLTSSRLFEDTVANVGEDNANKFTDFVLKAVSGNSAGTLTVQGSLGIKSEIEYLKAMVPGFSLGALAMTEGTGTILPSSELQVRGHKSNVVTNAPSRGRKTILSDSIPSIDLTKLIDNLKQTLKDEIIKEYPNYDDTSVDAEDLDTIDNQIEKTITALGDDKVKTMFGKVFEEFFKDKKGLVYKIDGTPNTYLVISQFGLHIIKRTGYDNAAKITAALKTDIANMAKDSSLPSATSIVDELTQKFTDTKIIEMLLNETSYNKALEEKLAEYNKDKTDDIDKIEIQDIIDVIESVNKLNDKTNVDGAIGDKLENWLVSKIDAGLRDIGTLTLSGIYQWVQDAQTNSEAATKQTATKGGTK